MAVDKPGEVYTDEEVERILAGALEGPNSKRNWTLIQVMVGTGIRVFELTHLRLCDMDLDNFAMRIHHGKGNKTRVVGISSTGCRALKKWLDGRKKAKGGRSDWVFVTATGKRMHESAVRKLLARLGVRIKLDHRLHPHGFRHTHARKLVKKNISIKTIQDQLGHADLGTTQRYVAERFPYERTHTIHDMLD